MIGPYRLIATLGEGGMGIVYLAEQGGPLPRRVAIKVIKPGMDSREVLRRFDSERRALAVLSHPHIATVFDAGTTHEGRPYFAMEYVDGIPLTEYCNRHHLDTTARLRLLAMVCDAIRHAHRNGIIHRDIKPSNVLVTTQDGVPVPKVIDFGVAKALDHLPTATSFLTDIGVRVGTLEYMSPEQAQFPAADVDPRTDVYSLGVLLYELLTGALPVDSGVLRSTAFVEIHRVIVETDSPRPSLRIGSLPNSEEVAKQRGTDVAKLRRTLQGELDWITMRAIDRDRARRYGSAAELATDLERYLRGQPVQARPTSAVVRARRLARRHRRWLIGIALGLCAALLLVGSGLAVEYYHRPGKRLYVEFLTLPKDPDRSNVSAGLFDEVQVLRESAFELNRNVAPHLQIENCDWLDLFVPTFPDSQDGQGHPYPYAFPLPMNEAFDPLRPLLVAEPTPISQQSEAAVSSPLDFNATGTLAHWWRRLAGYRFVQVSATILRGRSVNTGSGTERYRVQVRISGADDYAGSSTTAEFDTETEALQAAAAYVAARLYPIHHLAWQYKNAMTRKRPSWDCMPYESTALVPLEDRTAFMPLFTVAEEVGNKGLPDERRTALLLRGCAYLHGIHDPETARAYFVQLAKNSQEGSEFLASAWYELALCDYAMRDWSGSLGHLRDAQGILPSPDRWLAQVAAVIHVRRAAEAAHGGDECIELGRAVEAIDSLFTPRSFNYDSERLVRSQIHFLRYTRCPAEGRSSVDRSVALTEADAMLLTSIENPNLFIWRLRLGRLLDEKEYPPTDAPLDGGPAWAEKTADYALSHFSRQVPLLVEIAKTYQAVGRSAEAMAVRRTAASHLCRHFVYHGRRGVSFADETSETCVHPRGLLMAARCGRLKDEAACGPGKVTGYNFGLNAEGSEPELAEFAIAGPAGRTGEP